MGIRRKFFATIYDPCMKRSEKAGLAQIRRDLLAQAKGDVLEIGGGTGANLAYYAASITSLTLTEPDASMLKRLERRAQEQGSSGLVLRAPAEDLPFEDGAFDTVVSTLVLCGVDDQPRAVREVRRVLRPGGRFLFFEHVRAGDPTAAKKQDRMNSLNRAMVCCDCNRPTLDTIERAGLEVVDLEHFEMPKAPPFVRPAIVGSALAPGGAGGSSRSAHAGASSSPRPRDDAGIF